MRIIKWICLIVFAIFGPDIFGLTGTDSSFGKMFLWGAVFGNIGWLVGSIIGYIIYLFKPGI